MELGRAGSRQGPLSGMGERALAGAGGGAGRVPADDLAPPVSTGGLRHGGMPSGDGFGAGAEPALPAAFDKAQALLGDDPAGFTRDVMAYVREQGLQGTQSGLTYNRHADPVYQYLCLHTRAYARSQRLGQQLPTAQALKQEVAAEAAALQRAELRKPPQARAKEGRMSAPGCDTKRPPRQSDSLASELHSHVRLGIPEPKPAPAKDDKEHDGKEQGSGAHWKQARERLGADPSQWPQRIDEQAGLIRKSISRWKEMDTVNESIQTLRTMEHLDDTYEVLGGPRHPAGETKGMQSLLDRIEHCGLDPDHPLGAFQDVVAQHLGGEPFAYADRAEQYLAERIRTAGGVQQAGGMQILEADPVYAAMQLRVAITAYHPDGGTPECVGPFNRAMVDRIAVRFEDQGVRTKEQFMDAMQSGIHGNPFMSRATAAEAANLLLASARGPRQYRDVCAARLDQQADALGEVTGARLRARADPVHAAMSLRAELAQVLISSDQPCTAEQVERLARKCEVGYGILSGDELNRLVAASGKQQVVTSFLGGAWQGLRQVVAPALQAAFHLDTKGGQGTPGLGLTATVAQTVLPLMALDSDYSPVLHTSFSLPDLGLIAGDVAAVELAHHLGARDPRDPMQILTMLGGMVIGGAVGAALGAALEALRGGSRLAWLDDGPLTPAQSAMVHTLRAGLGAAPGAWWGGLGLRTLSEGNLVHTVLPVLGRAMTLSSAMQMPLALTRGFPQVILNLMTQVTKYRSPGDDPEPAQQPPPAQWLPSALADPPGPQFPVVPAGDDKRTSADSQIDMGDRKTLSNPKKED